MIDKRGSLSADLLAKVASPPIPEPAGASVAKAATRPAGPDPTLRDFGDGVLFGKGAASAAGFRPSYWSYRGRTAPPQAPAPQPSTKPAAASKPPAFAAAAAEPWWRQRQNLIVMLGIGALVLSSSLVIHLQPTSKPAPAPQMEAAAKPPSPPPLLQHDAAPPAPKLAVIAPPPASPPEMPPAAAAPPAPVAPALPPAIAPVVSAAPAQANRTPPKPDAEADDLILFGSEFLGTGDIASARLYFERGAERGDGRAALLVGETFDPMFLKEAGVRGLRGDLGQAAEWYRRARDLGEPAAQNLLDSLANRS